MASYENAATLWETSLVGVARETELNFIIADFTDNNMTPLCIMILNCETLPELKDLTSLYELHVFLSAGLGTT